MPMIRRIFILACLQLFGIMGYTQIIAVSKLKDTSLNRLINNINCLKQFFIKDYAITVLQVDNAAGTANREGTEEVTSTLYLGISEDGEYPKQTTFQIRNLYSIADIRLESSSAQIEPVIVFSFIDIKGKKPIKRIARVRLNLEKAVLL